MKKIILLIAVVALIATCYGQQLPQQSTPVPQTDYLLKSKNQKKGAWVLLGTGTSLGLIGIASFPKDYVWLDFWGTNTASAESSATFSGVLFVVGVVATLTSIPLFIASGKNKRKAMRSSVGFKSEQLSLPFKSGSMQKSMPAVAISIKL
ncbi:MAG TPA: hypothetical protein P5158_05485 [Chitinophagaceae bacterium]|nr:hypothetical protein [Chitinophagales bacterium]HRX93546.1 hypothetical protein [Chitinophagaceae bacterium]